LRTLKPIRYVAAKSQYKIELPANHGPPVEHVKDLPRQDRLAYGAYLAGPLAHCIGCHTPLREGGQQLDRSRAYAGGRELPDYGRGGSVISRNISPDPDEGIGKWSDAELKRATVAGIRPDGARMSHAMPFDWYKGMIAADLDAIVAHLRSVKPQKTPDR
jgi:mono/diheme cytochrome c family protein